MNDNEVRELREAVKKLLLVPHLVVKVAFTRHTSHPTHDPVITGYKCPVCKMKTPIGEIDTPKSIGDIFHTDQCQIGILWKFAFPEGVK